MSHLARDDNNIRIKFSGLRRISYWCRYHCVCRGQTTMEQRQNFRRGARWSQFWETLIKLILIKQIIRLMCDCDKNPYPTSQHWDSVGPSRLLIKSNAIAR